MKGAASNNLALFDGGNRLCHERKILHQYFLHQQKLKEITKGGQ
jgi:hypothetical protein